MTPPTRSYQTRADISTQKNALEDSLRKGAYTHIRETVLSQVEAVDLDEDKLEGLDPHVKDLLTKTR
jgi:hypothetical protein